MTLVLFGFNVWIINLLEREQIQIWAPATLQRKEGLQGFSSKAGRQHRIIGNQYRQPKLAPASLGPLLLHRLFCDSASLAPRFCPRSVSCAPWLDRGNCPKPRNWPHGLDASTGELSVLGPFSWPREKWTRVCERCSYIPKDPATAPATTCRFRCKIGAGAIWGGLPNSMALRSRLDRILSEYCQNGGAFIHSWRPPSEKHLGRGSRNARMARDPTARRKLPLAGPCRVAVQEAPNRGWSGRKSHPKRLWLRLEGSRNPSVYGSREPGFESWKRGGEIPTNGLLPAAPQTRCRSRWGTVALHGCGQLLAEERGVPAEVHKSKASRKHEATWGSRAWVLIPTLTNANHMQIERQGTSVRETNLTSWSSGQMPANPAPARNLFEKGSELSGEDCWFYP